MQLSNIAKARALVNSVREGFAAMHDGDIVTIELQPHADSRTIIGLDIGFVETYTAAIYLRLQNVDFGGMAIAALVHDPDLIEVTRAQPQP